MMLVPGLVILEPAVVTGAFRATIVLLAKRQKINAINPKILQMKNLLIIDAL